MKTELRDLVWIQSKLKAPKNQYNNFGKYKYRSAEDILEALKPLLAERNCQLIITDDVVPIGDRIYVKSTTIFTDSEGKQVTNCGLAREEDTKKGMDGSQITGTASSYARKYALNGLFLIDDTQDSDVTNKTQEVASEAELTQALLEMNSVTTRDEFVKVWKKWTTKFPQFANDSSPFYQVAAQKNTTL